MATEKQAEPKVEMTVQTEKTPVVEDHEDLKELVTTLHTKMDELIELREAKKTMQYEIERLRTMNDINRDLLATIRQKLFWQNNLEIVQMIDDTVRG